MQPSGSFSQWKDGAGRQLKGKSYLLVSWEDLTFLPRDLMLAQSCSLLRAAAPLPHWGVSLVTHPSGRG